MTGGTFVPDRDFFARPAPEVAPALLGAVLEHRSADGPVAVRLTEVEAYQGQGEDPGSHAHRGMGRRNAVMFGPPGHLYTYFTYGMHTCGNVVTMPDGLAAGVLLRGGEIVEGLALARSRRPGASDRDLARGPARLARAVGLTLDAGGADLLAAPFVLRLLVDPPAAGVTARTGVSGPGGTDAYPWRFVIPGEATVSTYRAHVPRRRG